MIKHKLQENLKSIPLSIPFKDIYHPQIQLIDSYSKFKIQSKPAYILTMNLINSSLWLMYDPIQVQVMHCTFCPVDPQTHEILHFTPNTSSTHLQTFHSSILTGLKVKWTFRATDRVLKQLHVYDGDFLYILDESKEKILYHYLKRIHPIPRALERMRLELNSF